MNVPALVTTGSATDQLPGALGQPGTQILFGGSSLNDDDRSGGRFTLGRWLCPCQSSAVEVTYLMLEDEDSGFAASSNEFGVLARPFFNTVTDAEDARLIGFPGVISGAIDVSSTTEFQTLEVVYRRAFARSDCARLDIIAGYRFAEHEDNLQINESSLALAGPLAGTTFDLFDEFDTRNRFHGGELGLFIQRQSNPWWSWDILAKLAIGGSSHRAMVAGQTLVTDNMGNAAANQGGLLAQGTNIGTYEWNDFATVSEFGVTLHHHMKYGLTASFGYTFIYWSNLARAGDQIDTTVNPTQIPPGMLMGEARPAFPFRTTSFWAQGLRLGLEYSF